MELGPTGVDVAEPVEVESCAEGKETNVEAVSDKSSESQPPTRKEETGPLPVQTADEASSLVPEPESTAPESTELSAASGLGTKMEASQAPSSTEEGEKNTNGMLIIKPAICSFFCVSLPPDFLICFWLYKTPQKGF